MDLRNSALQTIFYNWEKSEKKNSFTSAEICRYKERWERQSP